MRSYEYGIVNIGTVLKRRRKDLFFVCSLDSPNSESYNLIMGHAPTNQNYRTENIPLIDRAASYRTETATLALG
jgi:hypothetical protein